MNMIYFLIIFSRSEIRSGTHGTITNVLNTYPPQDSVGSDTQTGVALVQYPYWPLTRVAYLRTEGRPPHRSEISLGIFPFSNISMFND